MKGLASLAAGASVVIALTGCSSAAAPSPTGSTSAGSTSAGSTSGGPAASSSVAARATTTAGTPSHPPATPSSRTTTPSNSATAPHSGPPVAYRTEVLHSGSDHPDDLVLDRSGSLLYSDYTNGTISRLNADGTGTVVHRGVDGPEGMVLLADGTLVVAEENTNRLLAFAPGSSTATVLVTLPGRPVKVTCHEGVDGIAWDDSTQALVVPDPVTGTIYRLSPDGRSRRVLSTGFVHPVGAAVGPDGSVYVADECGGNVWRLGAAGAHTRVASAVMPDDVALDRSGSLLVTDVRHTRHDVRRWPLKGGPSTVLARAGLLEPQGLLIDGAGRVYVSDDQARVILRLTPAG